MDTHFAQWLEFTRHEYVHKCKSTESSRVSTNFTIGAHFTISASANEKYCISLATKAIKKGSFRFPFQNLERENGFEPSTYTLARYRSTN